ncbi:GNAT family N-acetyltransferase [Spirulina major]|uniref:GNAT family N-acetyltransferase n=1 Tax=Spirulina major TaxID=270636 RepID=UPI000933220A|nr:GNAT family N-acetyltransferase [Spirulina major]
MTESITGPQEVRELKKADYKALVALAKISFPVTQSRFVVTDDAGGLVVTINGKLVAASLLRIIYLPSGRKIGFVAWLMTHPEYRGRRLAQKLVEASTALLHAQQCDDIATDVEGYNTGSANVFYRSGYQRISMWQQLSRWNPIDSMWLWIRTGFALDPGHFLWVANAVSEQGSSWRGRFSVVVFNTLLVVLAPLLGGGILLSGSSSVVSVQTIVAFFVGVSSLLAIREMGTRLVSGFHKQPLEYRAWLGGGWGISLLIAIGFGAAFPLPGNLYPPGDGWSTRNFRTLLGQGAIVSTLFVTCLIILGSLLSEAGSNEFLAAIGFALLFVGKPLLIFDTLVAVTPFEGFNGRHLRDYNRPIWLMLSAIAVTIFIGA